MSKSDKYNINNIATHMCDRISVSLRVILNIKLNI